jgi:hypothetical protein
MLRTRVLPPLHPFTPSFLSSRIKRPPKSESKSNASEVETKKETRRRPRSACLVLRTVIGAQLKSPAPTLLGFNLVQLYCGCNHDRNDLHMALLANNSEWTFWIDRDISLHKCENGWRSKLTTDLQTALSYINEHGPIRHDALEMKESNPPETCLLRLHKAWTLHHETRKRQLFSFENIPCSSKDTCELAHSRALIYFYLISDVTYNWIPTIWQDIERTKAAQKALEQTAREAITVLEDKESSEALRDFMAGLINILQNKPLFDFGYRYALTVLCISAETHLSKAVVDPWRRAFECLCYEERCDYAGDCPKLRSNKMGEEAKNECTKFHAQSDIDMAKKWAMEQKGSPSM